MKLNVDTSFLNNTLCLKMGHFKYNFALLGGRTAPPIMSLQVKQIQATLAVARDNKDVLAVLPTSYGKSLIYELIPFVKKAFNPEKDYIALVCMPLTSIISEKIEKYGSYGIEIDEDFYFQNNECILNFTYVLGHPEHVTNKHTLQSLKKEQWDKEKKELAVICVDEAHCISQWGNDFRKAFLDIVHLRSVFPKIPMLALTGTAKNETKRDIVRKLSMPKDHLRLTVSLDRKNIQIIFAKKPPSTGGLNTAEASVNAVINPIFAKLEEKLDTYEKTVIYTKLDWCAHSNAIALLPKDDGSPSNIGKYVDQYTATCTTKMKQNTLAKFRKGTLRCIFATEAFSMGTDVPDIRQIIHIHPPASIDTYFQEIGRGERDGKETLAICYYNASDLGQQYMTEPIKSLCNASQCRREYIMDYYSSDKSSDIANCCDNCQPDTKITLPKIERVDEDEIISYIEQAIIDYLSQEESLPITKIIPIARTVAENTDIFQDSAQLQSTYPDIDYQVIENIISILNVCLADE